MTNRIAFLRRRAGLSQRELAEQMSVTSRTVQRWETGASDIPDARKLTLATFFKVSVTFLMGWDEPNGNGHEHAEAA